MHLFCLKNYLALKFKKTTRKEDILTETYIGYTYVFTIILDLTMKYDIRKTLAVEIEKRIFIFKNVRHFLKNFQLWKDSSETPNI